MCGIVSVLSFEDNISKRLISALERLEYRGYDSAGIAFIDENSNLQRIRSIGKIEELRKRVDKITIKSNIGIAHTRWATHGKVTEQNAHPHVSNGVAIVHNGIIENYQELKKKLSKENFEFESDTDTEVIAVLIDNNIKNGNNFEQAFKNTISELKGTFAIVAIYEKEPNILLGAKKGSPMAIGFSEDEKSYYIASDAIALSSLAKNIIYLEEGDIAKIERQDKLSYTIFDSSIHMITRDIIPNNVSLSDVSKNGYETFMLKEIFEEATIIRNIYNNFNYDINISDFDSLSIIACGTSYYAGLLAKYWIEDIAKIHVDVEIASEFRYRNPAISLNALYVFISQSGETIDTLCAMRMVKELGKKTLALVNVETSSIAREADYIIKLLAGVEIGVASTKVFVAQALSLLLLCVKKQDFKIDLLEDLMNSVLNNKYQLCHIAEKIKDSRSFFYIGRGINYPIALEGALKIKELSYVSAEGYPAGEIKHGPIAIIDENVYTIALAPFDKYFEKTVSNAQEILARNGKIILITTEKARDHLHGLENNKNIDCVFIPDSDDPYSTFPLITAIHLLAYYTSKSKGYDVDKPRNLAKSVTVE